MNLLFELLEFIFKQKKYWLLPIIIALCLISAFIVFTESSAVAPFIYALF